MRIVRQVNRRGMKSLTMEDHRIYSLCLDAMLSEVPALTYAEIREIFLFIENSMHYYLELCAEGKRAGSSYEGCMENLLFLVSYLLHYYYPKVRKEYLERLYDQAIHIEHFRPVDPAGYLDYEIGTGLLEKLRFYMDYYYAPSALLK